MTQEGLRRGKERIRQRERRQASVSEINKRRDFEKQSDTRKCLFVNDSKGGIGWLSPTVAKWRVWACGELTGNPRWTVDLRCEKEGISRFLLQAVPCDASCERFRKSWRIQCQGIHLQVLSGHECLRCREEYMNCEKQEVQELIYSMFYSRYRYTVLRKEDRKFKGKDYRSEEKRRWKWKRDLLLEVLSWSSGLSAIFLNPRVIWYLRQRHSFWGTADKELEMRRT